MQSEADVKQSDALRSELAEANMKLSVAHGLQEELRDARAAESHAKSDLVHARSLIAKLERDVADSQGARRETDSQLRQAHETVDRVRKTK